MKIALITGINGQDGSYLSELLLEKGYSVHGIVKKSDIDNKEENFRNIQHLLDKIQIHPANIENYDEIVEIVEKVQPNECYHFAAQSFTNLPFTEAAATFRTNIDGTANILEAIFQKTPACRFYFAGSSDMFGNVEVTPQNETTHFKPRNYYAISKIAGYHLTKMYRDTKGLFACCGILFNHESPRRGHAFVTRKISRTVARIKHGSVEKLKLGDLSARRDWGYSPDYVRAMWLMLQQNNPDDYVIATGKTRTVGDFVEKAFLIAGLNWQDHVEIDSTLFRNYEKNVLCGDPTKAKKILGWEPKFSFEELVEAMVKNDIEEIAKDFSKKNSS